MEETIDSSGQNFLLYQGRFERTEEFWREAFRARDDMKLAWAVWYGIIRMENWQELDYGEVEERYARYWGVKRYVTDDIAWTEKELALLRLSPVYKHYTVLPDLQAVRRLYRVGDVWLRLGWGLVEAPLLTAPREEQCATPLLLPNNAHTGVVFAWEAQGWDVTFRKSFSASAAPLGS